jgi:hypothetical protein
VTTIVPTSAQLPEATLAQIVRDLRALRESAAPVITSPYAERDVNIATNQTITYLSTIIYGPNPSVALSFAARALLAPPRRKAPAPTAAWSRYPA